MAACVGLRVIARKLFIPNAVMFLAGGVVLAFTPGVPRVDVKPDLWLTLFLPPLLQASAYRTDWDDFTAHLRPILLLAIGCVVFSAFAVGWIASFIMPAAPFAAALALGAIVAPPDAVSATAVLRGARLPPRLVTVLEGEGLMNDATAIVMYRLAVAAALAGDLTVLGGVKALAIATAGGLSLGFAVGWIACWIITRLDDAVLEIATSFLASYAAYVAAEAVGGSGVLACATCGLLLGRSRLQSMSAATRMDAQTVWSFVEFMLTSLVFILLGLQMNGILERLSSYSVGALAAYAGTIALALVASRFLWVFPATWLPRAISARIREQDPLPPWGHTTVVAWAGMRGVVSLALALALPENFPERDLVIFLAFTAILSTVLVQGATLRWVIGRLGVIGTEPGATSSGEAEARKLMARAALQEVGAKADDTAAADVTSLLQQRVRIAEESEADETPEADREHAQLRLRLAAVDASRKALSEQNARIDGETARALHHELDTEERQLRSQLGELGVDRAE